MTPAAVKVTPPSLTILRAKIERTDDAILRLIGKRAELARKVGAVKQRAGLPMLDPAREAQIVRRVAARARALGMPGEDVRVLFWGIIALCRAEQLPTRRARGAK